MLLDFLLYSLQNKHTQRRTETNEENLKTKLRGRETNTVQLKKKKIENCQTYHKTRENYKQQFYGQISRLREHRLTNIMNIIHFHTRKETGAHKSKCLSQVKQYEENVQIEETDIKDWDIYTNKIKDVCESQNEKIKYGSRHA